MREQVFIIEQASLYHDIDDQDLHSYHLYAIDENNKLVAYSRLYKVSDHASFGRVAVPKKLRGIGLGKQLVIQTLMDIRKIYGKVPVKIHAQQYAKGFYQKLGFKVVSKPFMEALRMHVKMLK